MAPDDTRPLDRETDWGESEDAGHGDGDAFTAAILDALATFATL